MFSGEWILIVLGNNGDNSSFAYERVFSIDAEPQQTVTVSCFSTPRW